MNLDKITSKLSARERVFALLCLLLVGSALLVSYAVQPYLALQERLDSQIRFKRIRLAKYSRLVALKPAALRTYDRLLSQEPSGGSEREMSRFLGELESLARRSSIGIRGVKPLPEEKKDFYHRFAVELETDASTDALVRFLYHLQRSPLILKVQRMNVSARGDGAAGAPLNVRLTITRIAVSSLKSSQAVFPTSDGAD